MASALCLVAIACLACTRPASVASKAAPASPLIQPFGDGFFVLHSPVIYRIGNSTDTVVVPAGFVTDLASIPGPGRALLHPNGPHGVAAIVHDYLYWNQSCTREEADGLFRLAMIESQVPASQYRPIYTAVRLGGARKFDDARRRREEGLPAIIPPEFRNLPALTRWRSYREHLKAQRVPAVPGPSVSRSACARGAQSTEEALNN